MGCEAAKGRIVIWDSTPWRNELLRVADLLERRQSQLRWTEQSLFLVERDIMVSAYAVRRLEESLKLRATFGQQISLESFPLRIREVQGPDQLNWHQIDRFFDLNKPARISLKPLQLCNQIIHSRVFLVVRPADHQGMSGFYVTSDYDSRKRLYYVGLDVFARILRQAGEEDLKNVTLAMDENGGWNLIE